MVTVNIKHKIQHAGGGKTLWSCRICTDNNHTNMDSVSDPLGQKCTPSSCPQNLINTGTQHVHTHSQTLAPPHTAHTPAFSPLTQKASLWVPEASQKVTFSLSNAQGLKIPMCIFFSLLVYSSCGIKGQFLPGGRGAQAVKGLPSPSSVRLAGSDLPNHGNLAAVLRMIHTSGRWKLKGNPEKGAPRKIASDLGHIWVCLTGEEKVVSLLHAKVSSLSQNNFALFFFGTGD